MIPFSRMDAASSARARSSKVTRGCRGFGEILSTETRRGCPSSVGGGATGGTGSAAGSADGATGGRCGRRAESPLPRALRLSAFIRKNLLRQLNICLRPAGADIVGNHRLPKARRFGQPLAAWDDRFEHVVPEELPEVLCYLAHQDGAFVEHGEEYALDPQ